MSPCFALLPLSWLWDLDICASATCLKKWWMSVKLHGCPGFFDRHMADFQLFCSLEATQLWNEESHGKILQLGAQFIQFAMVFQPTIRFLSDQDSTTKKSNPHKAKTMKKYDQDSLSYISDVWVQFVSTPQNTSDCCVRYYKPGWWFGTFFSIYWE